MSDFKDILKYLRNRSGLSQAELANKLGLGSSTISMYEVGEREPNFEIEEKIADFFNVDLNTLRGRDSERPLRSDEASLLHDYNLLNSAGKNKAREYITDLVGNNNYRLLEKGNDEPIQGSRSA